MNKQLMNKQLKRILLVDDSEATNAMNVYLFNRLNAAEQIDVAVNGAEAIDYLTAQDANGEYPRPELIVLDLNMPVMNGLEFLEAYRELEEDIKGGVIIIMLTTSMLESDQKSARGFQSVVGYQSKPLTLDKAQEMWSKCLSAPSRP